MEKLVDKALIHELTKRDVKHTAKDIVAIKRAPDGKIVFLERGNNTAGLTHIWQRHQTDFRRKGISLDQLPGLIMAAIVEGKPVGVQGRDRTIYDVDIDGTRYRIAISVSNNGYVISANPKSIDEEK